MISLNTTSDVLRVVLTGAVTTNQLTCFVSGRKNTTTVLSTYKKSTLTADATLTSITDTLVSGEALGIETIIVFNRDTVAANVTIYHYDGTILAPLYMDIIAPNGSIEYSENGWVTNGGVGSTNLFDEIDLLGISVEPSIPAAGILKIYSKAISGKVMLKQVGPSGLDTPLQNAFYQNNIVLFTPAAAAGVWMGTSGSNLGTPTIVLPTVTNLATMLRRSNFPSVVTTANQQVGTRTEAMFFRGNATNLGGFFFCARFMFTKWTAGNRLFVGLCSGSTAVVTVQPSTLLNMLGFGVDAGDTAITFMHNDGAGTCTKDVITGQPALATNQGYVVFIFCRPNDSTVYYRLDDINTLATIIDTSTSTDLPVNTTGLTAQCITGNAANIVAGDAAIGVNRIYIETDI